MSVKLTSGPDIPPGNAFADRFPEEYPDQTQVLAKAIIVINEWEIDNNAQVIRSQ